LAETVKIKSNKSIAVSFVFLFDRSKKGPCWTSFVAFSNTRVVVCNVERVKNYEAVPRGDRRSWGFGDLLMFPLALVTSRLKWKRVCLLPVGRTESSGTHKLDDGFSKVSAHKVTVEKQISHEAAASFYHT
jgi:hypothetical protein